MGKSTGVQQKTTTGSVHAQTNAFLQRAFMCWVGAGGGGGLGGVRTDGRCNAFYREAPPARVHRIDLCPHKNMVCPYSADLGVTTWEAGTNVRDQDVCVATRRSIEKRVCVVGLFLRVFAGLERRVLLRSPLGTNVRVRFVSIDANTTLWKTAVVVICTRCVTTSKYLLSTGC